MTNASTPAAPAPKLRVGSEAAEEIAQESSKGVPFPRVQHFMLKTGDNCVIRFLHERDGANGWITAMVHSMIATRPAPKDYSGGNWPKTMDAVCRHDEQWADFGFPDECYICDNYKDGFNASKPERPSPRTYAVCVMREELKDASGRRVGFIDATREEAILGDDGKPTGDTHMVPDVRLIGLSWGQFFQSLKGHSQAYGTLRDRDYFITRVPRGGKSKATDYNITPMDKSIYMQKDANGHGVPLLIGGKEQIESLDALCSGGDEDTILAQLYPNMIDRAAWLTDHILDDYYDRFFDLRHAQPVRVQDAEKDAAPTTSGADAAAAVPAQDVDDDRVRKMREMLMASAQPAAYPEGAPQG